MRSACGYGYFKVIAVKGYMGYRTIRAIIGFKVRVSFSNVSLGEYVLRVCSAISDAERKGFPSGPVRVRRAAGTNSILVTANLQGSTFRVATLRFNKLPDDLRIQYAFARIFHVFITQ
ncbi:hypothetical protein K474DRAFT_69380 [Panus rudis PR-1116 ss-1]|nr:hypothetical protein K474DRAFT_69380 [Panus rudis PR-1116 ss-1]